MSDSGPAPRSPRSSDGRRGTPDESRWIDDRQKAGSGDKSNDPPLGDAPTGRNPVRRNSEWPGHEEPVGVEAVRPHGHEGPGTLGGTEDLCPGTRSRSSVLPSTQPFPQRCPSPNRGPRRGNAPWTSGGGRHDGRHACPRSRSEPFGRTRPTERIRSRRPATSSGLSITLSSEALIFLIAEVA